MDWNWTCHDLINHASLKVGLLSYDESHAGDSEYRFGLSEQRHLQIAAFTSYYRL